MSEKSAHNPNTFNSDGAENTFHVVGTRFNTKKMSLAVDLSENDLSSDTSAALTAIGYEPKTEMHVTVIGFKAANQLATVLKSCDESDRTARVEHMKDVVGTTEWAIRRTGQLYALEKQYEGEAEPRRSIIELVDCPQVVDVYAAAKEAVPEVELEYPPLHVTLATQGSDHGIGLNTMAELEMYGRPIEM